MAAVTDDFARLAQLLDAWQAALETRNAEDASLAPLAAQAVMKPVPVLSVQIGGAGGSMSIAADAFYNSAQAQLAVADTALTNIRTQILTECQARLTAGTALKAVV